MLNIIYSVLSDKNTAGATNFVRAVDLDVPSATSMLDVHRLLVPSYSDRNMCLFCVEQLVQLCVRSLPSLAAELDPQNTYSNQFPLIVPSTEITGLPANVQLLTAETSPRYDLVQARVRMVFDVPGGKVTVDGAEHPLAVTDLLTSEFPIIEGVNGRLAGPVSGTFTGYASLLRIPERDLLPLDSSDLRRRMPWLPEYEDVVSECSTPGERIAATVLNFVARTIS